MRKLSSFSLSLLAGLSGSLILVGCGGGDEFSCGDTKTCASGGSAGSGASGGTGATAGTGASAGSGSTAGSAGTGSSAGSSGGGGAAGGGTGGTGALGGSAGSGGAPPECTSDSDCDDSQGCTGKETCDAGKCVTGTPVDCTTNPAHCLADCVNLPGGAYNCDVIGLDADGDDHRDAACTESTVPADDCDDTHPNVFAGATEFCDGLDNDCDGNDDLKDGFPLGGNGGPWMYSPNGSAHQPAAAWLASANAYGVVWTDEREGSPRVYFAFMSQAGDLVGSPKKLSLGTAGAAEFPKIASNGTELAVVWQDSRAGGPYIYLQRIDSAGNAVGDNLKITGAGTSFNDWWPSIEHTGTDWAVVYTHKDATGMHALGRLVGSSGQLGAEVAQSAATAGLENPAWTTVLNGNVASIWEYRPPTTIDWEVISWVRSSSTLQVQGGEDLTPNPAPAGEDAIAPRIGTANGNYAIAWRAQSGGSRWIRYVERASDGTVVCGPLELTAGIDPRPQAVVGHASGALILTLDAATGGKLGLVRVAPGCNVLDQHTPTNTTWFSTPERNSTLVAGPSGYATLWTEGSGKGRTLHRRTFGKNLCD